MAFLNETGLTRYDGKLKNLMAAAYSTSATYAVGDYCIHGGSLYRCTAAIESAESWTAAHWTKVNLGDEIDSAKEDITKLKLDVADAFSASDAHAVGDYVVKDGVLYCCTTAIGSGGETWTPGHWTAVNIGDELVAVKADIGILKSDLADAYDSTATYEVGDYCLKDGVLYRCTTAISTAEAWTAGHWTAAQVGDGLSELKGALTSVEKGLAIIVTGDTCSTAVPSGGYAYIKNNTHGLTEGLYRNKTASAFPTSGGTANSTVFEAVPNGGLNDITNSGAGYFRTADGTQICWGNFSATISDFSPYGTYYQGAGNPNEMFAQPFISAPNVVLTPYTNVWHTVLQVACSYEGFTNITVERQNNNTVTISDHYIAIGRWK